MTTDNNHSPNQSKFSKDTPGDKNTPKTSSGTYDQGCGDCGHDKKAHLRGTKGCAMMSSEWECNCKKFREVKDDKKNSGM